VYGTGSPVIPVYDTALDPLMDEWYPGLAYRPEEGAEEVAHSFKVITESSSYAYGGASLRYRCTALVVQ
jgi:hypothetical protein